MAFTKPPRLSRGDVVRVVAPSQALSDAGRERLPAGVAALEALGLTVEVDEQVHARDRHSAGTPAQRADALTAAWADPRVRMVLMAQGGQTANHLLDRLDWAALRRTPKVFSGMSDGTTLLSALESRARLVTFHGPDLLWGWGRPLRDEVVAQIERVLVAAEPATLAPAGLTVHRAGRASGPVVGGHTRILLATMAAGYGPDFTGRLLLLEGTDQLDQLDRHFTVLRLAGVFDRVAGLVLGFFSHPDLQGPGGQESVAEVALAAADRWDWPVVTVADVGHECDNVVVPFGVPALLDTADGVWRLTEPAVT